MLKKIKYFFSYYTVKEGHSDENGFFKVVMFLNRPRLIIGNMIQSGGMVRQIWAKAIDKLKKERVKLKKALIVGLGCGDCAFEINKYYPKAKMLGVEIDKKVVEIARCYFNLATVKNLSINIADGAKIVEKLSKQKKKHRFDLVIVDVYLGKTMPKSFRTKKFAKALTKILDHNGVVIYNHLFFDDHKQKAEKFIKEIEAVFGKISLVTTASNLLIFGWY